MKSDIVKREALKRLEKMQQRIKQAADTEQEGRDDTLLFIQELKDIVFLVGLIKDL